MRNALTCLTVLILAASTAAQRPRDEDMHERLTRRLEATIAQQKQVLEDIRSLLRQSLERKQTVEVDRARITARAEIEALKAQLSAQATEMQAIRREFDESKRKVQDLENKNTILTVETETLKSQIAAQTVHRQRLQVEIKQLKTVIEEERKKKKDEEGKKRSP